MVVVGEIGERIVEIRGEGRKRRCRGLWRWSRRRNGWLWWRNLGRLKMKVVVILKEDEDGMLVDFGEIRGSGRWMRRWV